MYEKLGDWSVLLQDEFKSSEFQNTVSLVQKAYATHTVYPPKGMVFKAFWLTPYSSVRVCILGQDPYHKLGTLRDKQGNLQGVAHGLAFSVPTGEQVPASLQNIYQEIQSELGGAIPKSGNLENWAKQGVLLLNTTLTVQAGMAGSHRAFGWDKFTDKVIALLNQKQDPVVFMLWGKDAISKKALLTNPNHLVLTSPHPSPLSAYSGFFGFGHFAACNVFLKRHYGQGIQWFEDQ